MSKRHFCWQNICRATDKKNSKQYLIVSWWLHCHFFQWRGSGAFLYRHNRRSRWCEEETLPSSHRRQAEYDLRGLPRHSASRWVCGSRNAALAKYTSARRRGRERMKTESRAFLSPWEAHLPSKQKESPAVAHSPPRLLHAFLPPGFPFSRAGCSDARFPALSFIRFPVNFCNA